MFIADSIKIVITLKKNKKFLFRNLTVEFNRRLMKISYENKKISWNALSNI